jgi:hypothetical protein
MYSDARSDALKEADTGATGREDTTGSKEEEEGEGVGVGVGVGEGEGGEGEGEGEGADRTTSLIKT